MMQIQSWGQIEVVSPIVPSTIGTDRTALWGTGFLPVFKTEEEAEREFPGVPVMRMKTVRPVEADK